MKCKAITGKGIRCDRDEMLSGYCILHFYIYNSKKNNKQSLNKKTKSKEEK